MKKNLLTQVLHSILPLTAARSLSRTIALAAIALAIAVSATPLQAPLQAQDAPSGRQRGGASHIQYQPPTLPNAGAPGSRRRGGASRTGSCPAVAQPLTALVPAVNESVGGLTTAANPTLWFYTPYTLNAEHPAEFVLLNDRNQYVYQTTLANAPTDAAGIIKIALPSTVALDVGKPYRWALTVNCGADSSVFVIGGIQRVAPIALPADSMPNAQPGSAAAQTASLDRAALYAKNGIWFDALTLVAELKQAKPDDAAIAAEWQSLLESATLEEIENQPFVP
jgi:Domain of Unknown Function (DUF928)